ncbi:MAG: N-acetylneuraminate synthase [Rhodospirillaceae bacterium]|jgi:N-acetylneuraminate synthase/sialic acid synthase|nr:N-acetylneuraminate synthase [Rhodospirillaceae bacterium]MBT5081526.1 N-acetylneuraminate synthase [Rhodospirillaceae bacterium]MBT5526968.1 N-acetylneuraminate synthase [Rhodospirillaceae bacterium]MBT5881864.1 N-acetylneuraminate synthase [Rhodospirillaceae bacterium]MBT6587569.1 N-acetylneuraminate synthase [Rhodospirillaceae bacterium]
MPREILVDGVTINDDSDCYVIAEIGHNHQGSLEQCKQMFQAAKECGASAVKLQKRNNRELYTKEMYDSPYDNRNSYGKTYGEHREAVEFEREEYGELLKYAGEIGITIFSTAFDVPSADFLAKLDMPAYKVASGDLTNIPLIKYIAQIGKPMFMSTGGGTMADVERAYAAASAINPNVCVMQCTSGYPAEFSELNLRVIETYRAAFPDCVIGLSSHDNGIAMALVGYVLGARVVEKHFTLNRAAKGTDNAFSLEPPGLKRLVRDLQRGREAMGDGEKFCYPSEEQPLRKMGKKLVATRDLPVGTVLAAEDVAIRSPNDGLPPYELDNVLGKKTSRAIVADENIVFEALS